MPGIILFLRLVYDFLVGDDNDIRVAISEHVFAVAALPPVMGRDEIFTRPR